MLKSILGGFTIFQPPYANSNAILDIPLNNLSLNNLTHITCLIR